ncbi:Glycosyltransferase involved in cell wall bisynthesis [Carnobacterium iners]|uniref:Glycosyltransferase involved in cell wall bisynthesis n=1 Tax=Carnobacterium iners TaxID=1073423 RepID=A0A1X7MSJ3_9LACT|nr:glycosyltransferase family 2 protein [Carnobacterium iners]SEL28254.1 Glycosyltransferase involved in cell wall bisynthesis [Carnobacterium iners]SMH26923.1 Glycosyltransferase involved in cell wall bisynthesis [Carnobacterium iners]
MIERISIVVPCFNEEAVLPFFYEELESIRKKLEQADIEYIFIDDGSKDQTLAVIKELAKKDEKRVRYLSFSRNFGKEAAFYAGLQHATGDYVAVMDADLQDPPELLPEMLSLLRTKAYDCIGTKRTTRNGEPLLRSFFAKQFYKWMNRISETEFVDGARDYRLMTRRMVEAVLSVSEVNRFSKGIFSWVGFETYYLPYKNKERVAGETSWSFWGLVNYSLDAVINFSDLPLMFASFIGIFSFFISILFLIFIVIRSLIFGDPTAGWPSLVTIFLAIGGLQLFCLGIVGKYLGKTYLETKKRPLYILKETNQTNEENN